LKAFLSYTIARLGLLGLAGGLGYIAGMRGPVLLIAAFLGSGVVSFVVLDKQRGSMGTKVSGMFNRINERIDENTRKEDID